MTSAVKDVAVLFERAYAGWRHDRAPQIAAAMSYYTLLSVAPLLVVIVTIVGRVVSRETVHDQLLSEAEILAGQVGANVVRELLTSAELTTATTIATGIAIVVALFGAARLFGQLRMAFDRMWHTAPQSDRPPLAFWKSASRALSDFASQNLKALLMVLLIGVLLLVSLGLSAAVTFAADRLSPVVSISANTLRLFDYVGSTLLVTVLFAAVYRVLPRTRIDWRDVWIGAAMTSLLFTLGRWLLGVYLLVASPGSAFGAVGSVVVFLIWVSYSSQILLFGAELTKAWTYLYGSRRDQTPPMQP